MNTPHTIGIVDLGSNSFHMMVAKIDQGTYTVLDDLKEPVRLRLGLQENGELAEDARQRALDCLSRFAQRLRGADRIRIVGTNTLRRARNTKAFLKQIEEVLGEPVDVIGGIEEARLIYLGVASHLAPSELRNFVVDIGGGSTECIIGRNLEPLHRETRPIGCVSISMDYFPDGVLVKKRFNKAVLRVRQELETFQSKFGNANWDRAIGASGTIKAIGAVATAISGQSGITRECMETIKNKLPWGKALSGNSLPGLREDRIPVFAGGFAVLYGVFETFDIQELDVSLHSMREGLMIDHIGRGSDEDVREDTVQRLKEFYEVDADQARRVKKTSLELFTQIMGVMFERRNRVRRMLGWAADLHEIGLKVAHSGYHKHGSYIIQNGDLDGFSQVEQCLLAFLVLNHRKRLKTDPLPYENKQEWPLVLLLRLAYIFNRERRDIELPDIAIDWPRDTKSISIHIDPAWLKRHPLTKYDLELEQGYWNRYGYTLKIGGI